GLVTYPRTELLEMIPEVQSALDWANAVQGGEVAWRSWHSPRDDHVVCVRSFINALKTNNSEKQQEVVGNIMA
ncbi:unnamed protein product, partial [Amoebophrya sp. A25]